jgi:hypothetical protein
MPGAKMHASPLRQPGCPLLSNRQWTRGFASPDCSGFAFSEFLFFLSRPAPNPSPVNAATHNIHLLKQKAPIFSRR